MGTSLYSADLSVAAGVIELWKYHSRMPNRYHELRRIGSVRNGYGMVAVLDISREDPLIREFHYEGGKVVRITYSSVKDIEIEDGKLKVSKRPYGYYGCS